MRKSCAWISVLLVMGLLFATASAENAVDGIVLVRNVSGSTIAASTAMSTSFTYLTS